MQLFLSFTPLLEVSVQETWEKLLKEITECETLVQEMERCATPDIGRCGYAYWHLIESGSDEERKMLVGRKTDMKDWRKLILKHKASEKLLDKLRESVSAVQQLLGGHVGESPYAGMLDPFLKRLNTYRSVVSEG